MLAGYNGRAMKESIKATSAIKKAFVLAAIFTCWVIFHEYIILLILKMAAAAIDYDKYCSPANCSLSNSSCVEKYNCHFPYHAGASELEAFLAWV